MIKKTISRAALLEAYQSMTVEDAAKNFGLSIVAFYRALDEAGIKRKNKRFKFEIVD